MKEIVLCPYCPVDDLDCPYYHIKSGKCRMYDREGVTPYDECDAFYGLDEEDEDEQRHLQSCGMV